MKSLIVAAAVLAALSTSAAAQALQPGPNLWHGRPFSYLPRTDTFVPAHGPGLSPLPYAPEPPPLGWVYGPYLACLPPAPEAPPTCLVQVAADGLNVRTAPAGPLTMALVNGTPLVLLDRANDWWLVSSACSLTPTFLWSWTAGVPLMRCWVW